MYLSGVPKSQRRAAKQQKRMAAITRRQTAKQQKRQFRTERQELRRSFKPFSGPAPVSLAPALEPVLGPAAFATESGGGGDGGAAPVMTYTDSSGNDVEVGQMPEDGAAPSTGFDLSKIPPLALVALAIGAFFLFKKGR